MKKISQLILILIIVLTVNGCSTKTKETKKQRNKYLTVKANEDNKIIISKDYIDTFKSNFKDLKEKTKQKGVKL